MAIAEIREGISDFGTLDSILLASLNLEHCIFHKGCMLVHEYASYGTVCGCAKVKSILEQYLGLNINSMVYFTWRWHPVASLHSWFVFLDPNHT